MSGFWIDDEDPEQPWTLARIYADLGTRTDIAAELNVTVHRMNRWLERRERLHTPQPLLRLGGNDIYSREEWRGWWKAWSEKTATWQAHAHPNGHGKPFFTAGAVDRNHNPNSHAAAKRRRLEAAAQPPVVGPEAP